MKKLTFTFLFFLGFALTALAQGSNYIFFTENGEQFYVVVNGIRQNEKPETNVMVRNINAMAIKVRIIFADTTLGVVDKMIPVPELPVEMTLNIKRDKAGKFQVRYMGEVPIAQAPPAPAGRTVVVYNTEPMPPIQQTTVTTTTTTTGTTGLPNDQVNVNMNVGGFGVNINVNDNLNQQTTQTTYTQTTTTTTSTPPPTTTTTQPTYQMPGYSGPVGCPWPMSGPDFEGAKNSIASKSFEDSKLTIAKQIFDNNCLLSSQVKQIMLLFSFEDSRLDFAKYAYGRTYDIGNYYKVNDAFTFESSIDDLNQFIQSTR
ncbi:MAG: DUF4476 domain-containing protein [Chitinophagales bacterium]|nr:DUF4476 domain-containing protein [Chitinophagales bacterium]